MTPRGKGKLAVDLIGRWPWSKEKYLNICQDGTCACNIITDDASWDSDTWKFNPDLLPPLIESLNEIAQSIKNDFCFEALWSGDKASSEVKMRLDEFIEVVKSNSISTNKSYKIKCAGGYHGAVADSVPSL